MEKRFIGEISPSPRANNDPATLICNLPTGTELSLILQDEMGRSWMDKRFKVPAGKTELDLGLPKLSPGRYNAWIEVNGETFIRPLVVNGNSGTDGILEKVKSWLNFI